MKLAHVAALAVTVGSLVTTAPARAVVAPNGVPVVTVSLPSSTAATATIFHGSVNVMNPPTSGFRLHIEFGEGRSTDDDMLWLGDDCTVDSGATDRWEFSHAYRLPGVWAIRATLTLGCGLGDANPQFVGTAPFVVTPGSTTANGPFRPDAFLVPDPPLLASMYPASSHGAGPVRAPGAMRAAEDPIAVPVVLAEMVSRGRFRLSAGDYDGFLSRYVIKWGDGSRDTVVTFDRNKCQEPPAKQYWPETETSKALKHPFKRGRYTTILTVTTVGCDGSASQTTTWRLRHRAT
jgi:hypothetical protein